jgi:hypothetical protein
MNSNFKFCFWKFSNNNRNFKEKGKVYKAHLDKIFGKFKQEGMDNVGTWHTKPDAMW